ncbi:M28 family peptidase [Portibacter lacus]|nr:M28 family peptidase [Portibacter lacus]
MKIKYLYFLLIIGFAMFSCKSDPKPQTVETKLKARAKVPVFNIDSSFSYLEKQLDFGFRIPGTAEHEATKDWLVAKFKEFGLSVKVQKFNTTIFNGQKMPGYNIIAQINSEHADRVIIGAHWDTRFIADKDPDEENHDDPIMGADDGASGVAAILELARTISQNPIDMGVDFILFDVEDQGDMGGDVTTWALGSQYWAKNKVPKNYSADFGILLDMIAAKGARFGREGYSMRDAGHVMDKVWKLAQNMGYSDLFQDYNAGGIADDHVYMNQAGIPTIDIISIPNPDNKESSFGSYHHTVADNIDIIDKRNLRVVGQVVLAVLYRHSDGTLGL